MKKELTEKLFKDFPEFFKHKDNLHASLMAFGFECSDGWFDLIYKLCEDIKKYFETEYDGYEWDGTNVKSKCFHRVPKHFYVVQVKEKFGGLRFYITAAPQKVHDLIDIAEHESYNTCEQCGKYQVPQVKNGIYKSYYRDKLPWVLTLCDECLDKHVEKKFGRPRLKDEDFVSDWQKKNKAPYLTLTKRTGTKNIKMGIH